ncbi:MAG: NADP-dependent isocitrate dehydrogenase [Deltaproteobacteria bacterium]|nr:NADP-dependent isocitrate dehydrogenase [Deltaproteobacteria bacterium]
MANVVAVALAKGDGIGPEISDVVIDILETAKCNISFDEVHIGKEVYERGNRSGIDETAWKKILRHKVLLKGPITTPQGGGYKSINVTLRKGLGLFANIRPCISLHPYVEAKVPDLKCVIVRENEEDLYAGIEYSHTVDSFHAIKIVSKPGTEKILRLAFQLTDKSRMQRVTCMTKDNILKITDGYFHARFREIAKEYPHIHSEHLIVDIGSAKLISDPKRFETIVTLNLYGDILSDIAAEATGSIGLAGSANLGELASMFEAVHGSAPDIAGMNLANPSGLLCAAVFMLGHIGQTNKAELIQNAWLSVIEQGIHTRDMKSGLTKKIVGTKEFGEAVKQNLGETPKTLKHFLIPSLDLNVPLNIDCNSEKSFDGADIYVSSKPDKVFAVAENIKDKDISGFKLRLISNRGLLVWPELKAETLMIDNFRLRFQGGERSKIPRLIEKIEELGLEVVKHECLFSFATSRSYSLAQGED